MLTYMIITDEYSDFLEDSIDYILLPFLILLDVVFIFFQPLFFIIYKYKKGQ